MQGPGDAGQTSTARRAQGAALRMQQPSLVEESDRTDGTKSATATSDAPTDDGSQETLTPSTAPGRDDKKALAVALKQEQEEIKALHLQVGEAASIQRLSERRIEMIKMQTHAVVAKMNKEIAQIKAQSASVVESLEAEIKTVRMKRKQQELKLDRLIELDHDEDFAHLQDRKRQKLEIGWKATDGVRTSSSAAASKSEQSAPAAASNPAQASTLSARLVGDEEDDEATIASLLTELIAAITRTNALRRDIVDLRQKLRLLNQAQAPL